MALKRRRNVKRDNSVAAIKVFGTRLRYKREGGGGDDRERVIKVNVAAAASTDREYITSSSSLNINREEDGDNTARLIKYKIGHQRGGINRS